MILLAIHLFWFSISFAGVIAADLLLRAVRQILRAQTAPPGERRRSGHPELCRPVRELPR